MGFVRLTYNMEQHTLKRYGKNTSSSSRDCNVLEKLLCFGNEIGVVSCQSEQDI
jgi:hypothetical protein